MNFIAPVFAALTFLGILPVLIHLHGRRRAKVRPLPTLMILLASHRRVAQRTKLRQLLLLLLRVLVMVAIPLCLAKPFIETASDLPTQVSAAQSAVLLLDDSLSMNYQPESLGRLGGGGSLLGR
ncbi:MAG TPA: BatA domain-containing protein, partial [Pseudomonadota bacterium]|nr:BatA domain-containing protein [Pseudomonadota bacterium]